MWDPGPAMTGALSASAGRLVVPLLDAETRQLPARGQGWAMLLSAASSQGLAPVVVMGSGASVLTFKCHSPILRTTLVSEASSDLVPGPRALSTGEGAGVERAPAAWASTLVKL